MIANQIPETVYRDPLSVLEDQMRAARAAARAARHTPEAIEKKRGGRRAKRSGYRTEKIIEARLSAYGFKRTPMSGALGGELRGDLRRFKAIPAKAVEVLEVKRRQGADKGMREQLAQGGAHALIRVPGGTAVPLVVVTLDTFAMLLGEAGYDGVA